MTEAEIMRDIQIAVSELGCRVWRNNIGILQDRNGKYVCYGVCNPGGSDLIGFTNKGRFLAIEVKTEKGTVTTEQAQFILTVNQFGGIAFVARSVSEAVSILENIIKE